VDYILSEHHYSTACNLFSGPFEALTYLWYTSKACARDALRQCFQHSGLSPSFGTRLFYLKEEYLTRTYH